MERNELCTILTPESMKFYQEQYFFMVDGQASGHWWISPLYMTDGILERARSFDCAESTASASRVHAAKCNVSSHKFAGHPHMALLVQNVLRKKVLDEIG